jgi:hypothetical protein
VFAELVTHWDVEQVRTYTALTRRLAEATPPPDPPRARRSAWWKETTSWPAVESLVTLGTPLVICPSASAGAPPDGSESASTRRHGPVVVWRDDFTGPAGARRLRGAGRWTATATTRPTIWRSTATTRARSHEALALSTRNATNAALATSVNRTAFRALLRLGSRVPLLQRKMFGPTVR